MKQTLTEEEFIQLKDLYDDWEEVIYDYKLPEIVIEKYHNQLDWDKISFTQRLSETFILKFQHKVCWEGISLRQQLNENFIERFQDKIIWEHLPTIHTKLSEVFIAKHTNKLNWNRISLVQDFSYDFFLKNVEHIRLDSVVNNKNLSERTKNKAKELLRIKCVLG